MKIIKFTKNNQMMSEGLSRYFDSSPKPTETVHDFLKRLLVMAIKSHSWSDIAEICGVTRDSIRHTCRKYKIKSPPRSQFYHRYAKMRQTKFGKVGNVEKKIDTDTIKQLVHKHKAIPPIAEELNTSYGHISKTIHRLNKKERGWLVYHCAFCGRKFNPKRIDAYMCSRECGWKAKTYYQRIERNGMQLYHMGDIKKCDECGKDFEVKNQYDMIKRYCSRKCCNTRCQRRWRHKYINQFETSTVD